MYRVELDKAATKSMLHLPPSLRRRIFAKLDEAKADPYRRFLRLAGRTDFRMRVGDYRVFAVIDAPRGTIAVTAVKHRRNAYD